MFLFELAARTVSIRVYGRYQIAGKKSNLETQMERLMKQTDLEEQGDAPKLLKTAGIGILHHLASSTSIRWPKCWVEVQELVVSSREESVRTTTGRIFVTELDVDTLLCS